MSIYTLNDLARLIDHTNLHPDATCADMKKLCDEAKQYHFRMVAVNSVQSRICSKLLAGTDVHTGAAIGFPLGQTSIAVKAFETKDALENGASEIDYVVNLTEVKAGNWMYVQSEMEQIVSICREAGVPSKVIFENCLLSEDEKLALCKIASEVLPSFVKTSTGFSTGGATVEDVRLMREMCIRDSRYGVCDIARCQRMAQGVSSAGRGCRARFAKGGGTCALHVPSRRWIWPCV